MEPAAGRCALALGLVVVALLAGVIGAAAWIARDHLFGIDPSRVHDPSSLRGVIAVCGRDYRGGTLARSLVEILDRDGRPPTLVDPAPFAPCPAPNAVGDRPCTREALGPCSTVVYIRIAEDAYVEYALAGGP